MKRPFTTRGYLRTILLSALAAFVIESFVNLEEVKAAYAAGKDLKQATTALQSSTEDWLKVPQHLSKVLGRISRILSH